MRATPRGTTLNQMQATSKVDAPPGLADAAGCRVYYNEHTFGDTEMIRAVLAAVVALVPLMTLAAQEKDSPIVAKTRKKLETKITVEFKDERLKDVIAELEKEAEVKFRLDTKGGVSGNMSFTYKAEEKSLKDILGEMFKGKGLGYIIHRKQNNTDRYEGYIDIVQGDQRGDDKKP
jgi:hypothetical protein